MKSGRLINGLLLLAVLAPVAVAQKGPELRTAMQPETARRTVEAEARSRMRIMPTSKVWVEGGSTVRSYRCEAKQVSGTIHPGENGTPQALGDLQSAVRGVHLAVSVPQMDCGNGQMDAHMRKALKSDAHPHIQFNLNSHQVTVAGSKATVRMNGRLSIAGKENPVTLTAEATQQPNGSFRIVGKHEFPMTQFGVQPPTLMMGTLKVHDPVVVHFEMILGQ